MSVGVIKENDKKAEAAPSILLYVFTHLRSVLGIVFVIFYTLLASILSIIFGTLKMRAASDWVCQMWGAGILKTFNIDVKVEGQENIPKETGAVILFNHQSYFDIPVIFSTQKYTLRFGAKIELFRWPFFGAGMRAIGILPIVRENRAEVFRVYKSVEKKFLELWYYALAPEGTRQKEDKIGRFKKGPFIFAINAQAPLVPVVIRGALGVNKKGGYACNVGVWRRTIHVRILPPILTKAIAVDQVTELTENIREDFVKAYAELPEADVVVF